MDSCKSEQFRHECECRYWLDETGGNRALVEELMQRIEKKRGKAAATRLYRGMRDEYLARKEREKEADW